MLVMVIFENKDIMISKLEKSGTILVSNSFIVMFCSFSLYYFLRTQRL